MSAVAAAAGMMVGMTLGTALTNWPAMYVRSPGYYYYGAPAVYASGPAPYYIEPPRARPHYHGPRGYGGPAYYGGPGFGGHRHHGGPGFGGPGGHRGGPGFHGGPGFGGHRGGPGFGGPRGGGFGHHVGFGPR